MSEDIASLIKLSDAELYRRIAADTGSGLGPRDIEARGREMFETSALRLRAYICGSPRVKDLWLKSEGEGSELIAAIADCISTVATGISPFIIATLLFRRGLDRLCSEAWATE